MGVEQKKTRKYFHSNKEKKTQATPNATLESMVSDGSHACHHKQVLKAELEIDTSMLHISTCWIFPIRQTS